MTDAQALGSGKGHRDENFPVASILIEARHRPAILAFYRFARAADDIADHATASADEKLRLLETFRASLMGEADSADVAVALRETLKARNLSARHAADLLEAFRRDVSVARYGDWDALMDYCRYSAMPVGRFVLDVHGESESIWPANDALCAALQVINHLQDCGEDYRDRNRVYVPLDALQAERVGIEALAAEKASPALREALANLTHRNAALLERARPFAQEIKSGRLAFEVTVIQRLAEDLNAKLMLRDPLSERVHHGKGERIVLAMAAAGRFISTRFGRNRAALALARDRQ
jgi:squalene synthase HpnC